MEISKYLKDSEPLLFDALAILLTTGIVLHHDEDFKSLRRLVVGQLCTIVLAIPAGRETCLNRTHPPEGKSYGYLSDS